MAYGNPEKISAHDPAREYRRYLKMVRNRKERRRAKRQPDCPPGYQRFYGWSL